MFTLQLQKNISLRQFNTFGIDVKAYMYLSIHNLDTLLMVFNNKTLLMLPRLILGGGSNILLTRDFPGLVLHICFTGVCIIGEDNIAVYVKAAAGENWNSFVQWTLAQGLGGLENLSLIPGSVGATPIQNIGAYGMEVKDRLHSLTIFDCITGKILILNNADCNFAYRESIFKKKLRYRAIVLDVTFAMPKKWKPVIDYADIKIALTTHNIINPSPLEIAKIVIAIRTCKLPDPTYIGNGGSFFKNPIIPSQLYAVLLTKYSQLVSYIQTDGNCKLSAAWLIDQCGWRGKILGPVGVYEKQALILINLGGASGRDIIALAQIIQTNVLEKFGISLESELVCI